jgi:long-chain acyl-CoA synthetase
LRHVSHRVDELVPFRYTRRGSAVAEVTVIGVPDANRGQSAKAFIALRAGAAPFTYDELEAFLSDKLAKYEMPTEMEFRTSLPKTPAGKISKKELIREELSKRRMAVDPSQRELAG